MDFKELMAQASKNAARAQQTLVERDEERRRAERAKEAARLERGRRTAEIAARQRREREARDKELERARQEREKVRALSKARNSYQARQERKKRGMPLENDDDDDEQERIKKRKMAKAFGKQDVPSSGGMALAKAMMAKQQQQQQQQQQTTMVRPIDGMVKTTSLPKRLQPPSPNKLAGRASSVSSNGSATSKKSKAPRTSAVPAFDPATFKALNTNKRDLRTIEEIERDLKLKKLEQRQKQQQHHHASRSTSEDDLSSGSSDALDRDSKGSRGGGGGGGRLSTSVRDEIWNIVSGGRRARPRQGSLSDDTDDMEVSGAQLEAEEKRASLIAMREDRQEQERLERHALEKRMRKQQNQSSPSKR